MIGLVSHEMRRLLLRPRTWIGFGAFVVLDLVFFLLLHHPKAEASFARLMERQGLDAARYGLGLTQALMALVFTFLLLGALYISLVSGDIVAKEAEEGTLRLVMARPVSRFRMLMAKVCACTLHTTLLMLFLAGTALLMARVSAGGWGGLMLFMPDERVVAFHDGSAAWGRLAAGLGLLALNAQVMSALAFCFSCFDMKAAAATILALSCLFIDLLLTQMPWFEPFQGWGLSWNFRAWMRVMWDPVPWPLILRSELMVVGLTVTLYAIGIARFSVRDLKG